MESIRYEMCNIPRCEGGVASDGDVEIAPFAINGGIIVDGGATGLLALVNDTESLSSKVGELEEKIETSEAKIETLDNEEVVNMTYVKRFQEEMKKVQRELKTMVDGIKATQDDVKTSQTEMKTSLAGVKSAQAGIKTTQNEMKTSLAGVKSSLAGVKADQARVQSSQTEMKLSLAGVNSSLAGVKASQGELEAALKASIQTEKNRITELKKEGKPSCKTGTFTSSGQSSHFNTHSSDHYVYFSGFSSKPQFLVALNSFHRTQEAGNGDLWWGVKLTVTQLTTTRATVRVTGVSSKVTDLSIAWIACPS